MKKNLLYLTTLLLSSLALGACGNDEEEVESPKTSGYVVANVSESPTWQVDWTGNDVRPDWVEPMPSDYENWAVLFIQLEDELKQYASDDDLLALFVDEELRGLASPAIDVSGSGEDRGSFLLKSYGNEGDQRLLDITLRYYCSELNQIFTRSTQMMYTVGEVLGVEEDLIPQFTLGSPKYPVSGVVSLDETPIASANIEPNYGDLVAAFVADECRGVTTIEEEDLGFTSLIILGRKAGENVTLKYYDSAQQRILTFENALTTARQ